MNKMFFYRYVSAVFLILALLVIPATPVFAGNFGGKIMGYIPCTAPWGLALIIGPPVPGIFLYIPGASKLHANMKPIPGSWVLGDYSPLPSCVVGVCPACWVLPLMGLIGKFGTS